MTKALDRNAGHSNLPNKNSLRPLFHLFLPFSPLLLELKFNCDKLASG